MQLALSERASERAGREEETQKRLIRRRRKGREKENSQMRTKKHPLDGTLKQLLCNGGQSEVMKSK